jgi:hypothetical protein
MEDSTKRCWLTATLSTKTHMAQCLSRAKVTEMSIMAIQTGSYSNMPWYGFYNIILAHAKLQDHTKSITRTKVQTKAHEQGRGSGRSAGRGRGAGTGRGGRTGCGPATSTADPDQVFTAIDGPNTTMKANQKNGRNSLLPRNPNCAQLKVYLPYQLHLMKLIAPL